MKNYITIIVAILALGLAGCVTDPSSPSATTMSVDQPTTIVPSNTGSSTVQSSSVIASSGTIVSSSSQEMSSMTQSSSSNGGIDYTTMIGDTLTGFNLSTCTASLDTGLAWYTPENIVTNIDTTIAKLDSTIAAQPKVDYLTGPQKKLRGIVGLVQGISAYHCGIGSGIVLELSWVPVIPQKDGGPWVFPGDVLLNVSINGVPQQKFLNPDFERYMTTMEYGTSGVRIFTSPMI